MTYTAKDIQVLEGLEPVRLRPGMYIGGTDTNALHHLVAEILDNSMDEAVAGHADKIWFAVHEDGHISIRDNGRGIPIDPHPKYKNKSALEVILTTLHSGGKFENKAYATSGGLHGVGISVVNALSSEMIVEVARDGELYKQSYSRGKAVTKLEHVGPISNRRGTLVSFKPDTDIFDEDSTFDHKRLYKMVRSKAYMYRGVTIYWEDETAADVPVEDTTDEKKKKSKNSQFIVPRKDSFHYPNGLEDFLQSDIGERLCVTSKFFSGTAEFPDNQGRLEWAVAWPFDEDGSFASYCNTIPTPQGGTHETGFRSALLRSLKQYAELRSRKLPNVTAEDLVGPAQILQSIFIPHPQFQGQTKDKLTNREASRLVDNAVKDTFDHWLIADTESADALLEKVIDRANDRLRRKSELDVKRKTATSRRLTLPGKLADCSNKAADDTELFIVEGDSAGGSAKQARDRKTQAILPLRGKILNVASATKDKMQKNQELKDLIQALGCGIGKTFNADNLRYERIIIMTDADVDGAHIATLLLTFFFQEMTQLIQSGCVYLALPPLYKLTIGSETFFCADDAEKEKFMEKYKHRKIEITRFKGLGEMPAQQLKVTTMNPKARKLLQIKIDDGAEASNIVRRLMGKQAEERLLFIRENASAAQELDI